MRTRATPPMQTRVTPSTRMGAPPTMRPPLPSHHGWISYTRHRCGSLASFVTRGSPFWARSPATSQRVIRNTRLRCASVARCAIIHTRRSVQSGVIFAPTASLLLPYTWLKLTILCAPTVLSILPARTRALSTSERKT